MASDNELLTQITAINLAHQAAIETLFDFCVRAGERINLTEIDGVPLEKWLTQQKHQRMDSILILLENSDPALAAKFQQFIDDSRKRTGINPN